MSSDILEAQCAPLSSLSSSSPRPTCSSPVHIETREASSRLTPDSSRAPSLVPPIPASNTLVFTGLLGSDDFDSDRVLQLRLLVESASSGSVIHWGPVPSFGRIFAVFKNTADALEVRRKLDGIIYGSASSTIRIYFADSTPIEPLLSKARKGPMSEIERQRDTVHLQLPDPGRLFLISPPPSPPVGWESQLETPPNTNIGFPADILNEALTKLMREGPENDSQDLQSPLSLRRILQSELEGACGAKFELYSDISSSASSPRSPSVVIIPPDDSDGKPGIIVSDFCNDTFASVGSNGAISARTQRPPIHA
ncbi:Calcipressin-domain-containing protein [Lipomyces chichibuensis]|uniref:Calcipressin-domain-containing protein n=1 Tax=Lipomyces chichibuensis TaxID=1546026 RepID=UPI0033437B61